MIRHRKGSEPTGWQPFAEGLREMNIPQDVIGNRDRLDWMHRDVSSPRTPDDSYVTPAQKRVSSARKRASRISVSVRKTNQRKLEKLFHSPKKLSASKKLYKRTTFLTKTKRRTLLTKTMAFF